LWVFAFGLHNSPCFQSPSSIIFFKFHHQSFFIIKIFLLQVASSRSFFFKLHHQKA
jgi:hypothetical protein